MTSKKIKVMRNASFGLAGLAVLVLAAATVVEAAQGSTGIYGSPLFVALWTLLAVSSVAYILACKMARRKSVFMLHLSLVVILVGAFVTYVWGERGTVHLRQGDEPVSVFRSADGGECRFPFGIVLDDFEISYYPGTAAPNDFVSTVMVHDGGSVATGKVSMNHVYEYGNYRFYQSTYDSDGLGSTLSVCHDPVGIAVTYAGYAMLLFSAVLFFFDRGSGFRRLLRHPALRRAALCIVLPVSALAAQAAGVGEPKALPESTAKCFGDLYVYYNGRVSPLQTLARDFTVKLCGKTSYRGLTAEQVFTGWFFYYDDWKEEPMIRIKSGEVQQLLGIEGEYARLVDFVGPEGYKLGNAHEAGSGVKDLRGVSDADEKFSLVSAVCTGRALKIFPYRDSCGMAWYSVADRLPASMPQEQWMFVRYCMNYIAERVACKDYAAVDTLLAKTRKYQQKEAAEYMPGEIRVEAEKLYNKLGYVCPVAILCIVAGLASFFLYCRRMICVGVCRRHWMDNLLVAMTAVVLAYVVLVLALRGIVGGYFPASNGFETMHLMAACVLTMALVAHRRFEMALSFGFMLCGLALLVAMMGEANPPVTPLMPVLSSPLLSIHVAVIMVAYSLFGFAMFNGIAAVVLYCSGRGYAAQIVRLQVLGRLMLYPAVFLLAAGIFVGAVWANVSWGRYWGWDPKEVWALVTMLVYALALHPASLPWFRRPVFFHAFCVAAFLCVLVTYFGVNFLLGGMHSYA